MPTCARCGAHYDEKFDGCPLCANSVAVAAAPATPMYLPNLSSLLGYGGALLLVIGTFLPALKLSLVFANAEYPLLGGSPAFDIFRAASMSLGVDSPTQGFQVLGFVLVVLALATAVLSFAKIWIGLVATGGVALFVIGNGFFTLNSKITEFISSTGTDPRSVAGAIQPGWGWAILLIGALLILGAALSAMFNRG